MASKRAPAAEVAKPRSHNGLWIDHARIVESDYEWLANVERLTLWNVQVPAGFLARLANLWWLDIRGGSASDIAVTNGADKLQYLAVNQVRGVSDLSLLSEQKELRYLDLYGLPKVCSIPSLKSLASLERVQLGQMKALLSISGLLDAPNLCDLRFVKKVNLTDKDVCRIVRHPAIRTFGWSAEDVPLKEWQPVVEKINLPGGSFGHPEDWFGLVDWRSS